MTVAVLLWPSVAVLGFLALNGVVIALGISATARYEFARNQACDRRERSRRSAPAAGPERAAERPSDGAGDREPAGRGVAAPTAVAVETSPATGWWLVDESAGQDAPVFAGPFADRVDADWAALATRPEAPGQLHSVYGVRRPGGTVARKASPQELAWLAELGDQLDRLSEDWDPLLSDTDPLTTLVVEVTAALVEAGLPLHDCAGRAGGPDIAAAGGVCLTPDPGQRGILVSWQQHDRMSLEQVRGAEADAAVQRTMNTAVAGVLTALGFPVEPFGRTGCHLLPAGR